MSALDGTAAARATPAIGDTGRRRIAAFTSRGLSLGAWLAIILIAVVVVIEAVSIAFYFYEVRSIQRIEARDRAAMTVLWAAKAIRDAPPELLDKIPPSFGQSNRVLFLEEASAVRATDDALAAWRHVVEEWLRANGLTFSAFNMAAREVYLPRRPPVDVVYNDPPQLTTAFARRLILLPNFADERTPNWVKRQPGFQPEDPENFRKTTAYVYALQLEENGPWLNMYALEPITNREGVVLKIALTLAAAVAASLIAVWLGRGLIRPLRRLAVAADRLGRGEQVDPLPVSGTRDVRTTVTAFNRMSARVKQNAEYASSLIYSLGHDLKGPLAAVRAMVRRSDIDAGQREIIERRFDQIDGVMGSIMQFARTTAGDGPIESTELVALATAVAEQLDEAGERVTVEGPDALFVRCRFNALERVLQNLIGNGLKYGSAVTLRVDANDDMARIVVDDDGPGIPVDLQEEMFQPFRRAESDEASPGGSGLGLAIARAIVIDHGGRIAMENRPEGGLRVTVWLPL